MMKQMLNRICRPVSAIVLSMLVASGGMASTQQADNPVSGDRPRAGGFVQPNVNDLHILRPWGQSIRVYGAAQNETTSDPDEHVYLYEPPLRFRIAADGMIDVRRNNFDQRKVTFYLEGLNQDIEKRIQELLDGLGIKVLARNVRPLQYTYIAISDDSGQWVSRYPENNESLPALQDWIPVEVDFTSMDDGVERADEFENRLKTQEVEFDGILVYGGRELSINAVELTVETLLESRFYIDLTGNGEFAYVTRNQIRNALATTHAEIQKDVYIEDPNAIVPPLEWPEETWDRITVAWDDFLDQHQVETTRYSFDRDDLTPDKFTLFEEHLKSEMEDETKNHIDISASMEAEAGFLGLGGSVGGSGRINKEDFERRKRNNENGVKWEGEVFRPTSIDLFVMDADRLRNETRISSYVITARPETEQFEIHISSQRRAEEERYAELRDDFEERYAELRDDFEERYAELRDDFEEQYNAALEEIAEVKQFIAGFDGLPDQTYRWRQGQGRVSMIGVEEGICYLTFVTGEFRGGGETVYVRHEGGTWYLGGTSQQQGVGGEAHCWKFPTLINNRPR